MDHPTNRKVLYALLATIILLLSVAVNSVVYTNYKVDKAVAEARKVAADSVRKSQLVWCVLLLRISENNKENPPTTPFGKAFAETVDEIKNNFGC